MLARGIRGAITLESNDKKSIKNATVELVLDLLEANDIQTQDIAFAIFTVTPDINADFPAKYAREYCGFEHIPMMCYREMDVKESIKMCLRVMIVINTTKPQHKIKHRYLRDAKSLRSDITE